MQVCFIQVGSDGVLTKTVFDECDEKYLWRSKPDDHMVNLAKTVKERLVKRCFI
jgi:hypothetical protein